MPWGKHWVEVSVSGLPAFLARMRRLRISMYFGFSGGSIPGAGPSRYS